MEQKDIDVYEILKDVPKGTEFYTSLCGNVGLAYLESNKEAGEAIWTKNKDGEYSFNKNGRWMKGGEVTFFPSKQMRDWSKFFKKGDVLEYAGDDEGLQGSCTFEKFEDETKTRFLGRYVKEKEALYSKRPSSLRTADWVKSDDPADYIRFVEERLGGKLNRETLEIEKPAKLTFEVGKLYVFSEEDEDGELTIICELIAKNESEDTLTFGNQYEIETEKFVTDQAFDLRISVNKELREATENEVELFNKHYAIWKEQPCFKTFDKVLVSIGSGFKWRPALFIRDHGENCTNRYNVLPLYSGKPADFEHCIPYEGYENIAFADYNSEDLPLPF
nr:hypothetical protein [Prevotella sp.]